MTTIQTRLKWNRSEDGYTTSKCERFVISPLYRGTTRPTGFEVEDMFLGRRLGERETQRDAKEMAEMQLDYEAMRARGST